MPAIVVVLAGVVAEPRFVAVSFAAAAAAAVEPTVAALSVVVVAVDRSAVDISVAAAAVAGAGGWSMAEAAGCSWLVSTCCEVGGPSCCSQSWEDPVMLKSEVAGRRSVLTDIVVVVVVGVVVTGQLGLAAEAAEV